MKNIKIRILHTSLIIITLMGMTACFSERSPNKPDENTSWITPTEPSILIENLKKAFTKLDLNNYRRCFLVERFSFRADNTLLANNLGLFSVWNWDNENQFFNNLNRAGQPVNANNQFQLTNIRTINYTIDSLEYTADYMVSVYHQDTAFSAVNFSGLLTFQMKRNRQNEWQIVTWQDNKTKPATCLTELRQHFFAR